MFCPLGASLIYFWTMSPSHCWTVSPMHEAVSELQSSFNDTVAQRSVITGLYSQQLSDFITIAAPNQLNKCLHPGCFCQFFNFLKIVIFMHKYTCIIYSTDQKFGHTFSFKELSLFS
ncbi:hypothetical protein XENOCAPTIV_018411 [Xenoophorus captivus]|uniref:Uncharacterized protein n=1 Tax=Xenoophorus captivus TaxID=1517983 RepID=A0ABV0SHQ8_9TELE